MLDRLVSVSLRGRRVHLRRRRCVSKDRRRACILRLGTRLSRPVETRAHAAVFNCRVDVKRCHVNNPARKRRQDPGPHRLRGEANTSS